MSACRRVADDARADALADGAASTRVIADDIARGVVTPRYADVPFEELFEWNPGKKSPTAAAAANLKITSDW